MVCVEGEKGVVAFAAGGGALKDSTIAAIATPPGRGGIGVIRLSGPDALRIASSLTRKPSGEWLPRHAHFCRWYDADGEVLDSGIAIFFPSPHSYTGEDVVELQGHGGMVLMRAVLSRLYELGCRPAEPGEFTRRAVENQKMDLTQAEAVAACIDASTLRAAKQAQRQLQGAFGRTIEELMDRLTGVVAHLEASLDFPEEEIPPLFFDRLRKQVRKDLISPIQRLLATATFGERLFAGATVAIIGAPNVGKSSLLNKLTGRERAIVSDIPGTTRDVLEADFEVRGIPVRLADTAGMRDSGDAIEREGVRRALQMADQADVVVYVADAGNRDTWSDLPQADIYLMNKMDLGPEKIPETFLPISVKRGEGIDLFLDRLASLLGDVDIGGEDVVVTRERHRLALTEALRFIESGLNHLYDEQALDLAAMDWRCAWSALGGILGIGDVEYILDRVFSEFCIGK